MAEQIIISVPADLPQSRLEEILAAVGDGATVERTAPPAMPEAADPVAGIAALIDRFSASASELPGILSAAAARVADATGWSVVAILAGSFAITLVAYGVERAVRRASPRPEAAAGFSARLLAGARFAAGRLFSLLLFVVVATALSRLVLPGGPAQAIFAIVLGVVTLQRGAYAIFDLIFAPAAPARRLAGLSAESVATLRLAIIVQLSAVGAVRIAGRVTALLTGPGPADDAVELSAVLLWLVIVAATLTYVRAEVAELIRRGWPGLSIAGVPVERAARWWLPLGLALAAANAAGAAAAVLDEARLIGFAAAWILLLLLPFILAALAALREEALEKAKDEDRPKLEAWYALAEGAAIVGAVALLLSAWDIDPFGAPEATGFAALGPGLVGALCAIVVGLAVWRAVRAFLSELDPAPASAEHAEGEGMGKQGSRLETIAPILRGFTLALVAILTAMIALSALGVNITPLLAGAGVFGLAIGFGAQTLVSDVISGFFYLYEDAFRVGEYIETAEGKGVVESISLRSVRLRHHRGPVYTVPFSAMGTIQNHSRDWVIVKFTFQVPSDNDVETVRKTVKKVGEALLQDPEIGEKFLQPVKSQGAIGITGSAFDIGVKYMTRPGDQFTVRKKVYAALQKALAEKGITLYRPAVMLEGGAPAAH